MAQKLKWLEVANSLESSYKTNEIGQSLYSLVRMYKPKVCVEIGVLAGYSAIFTLAALRDNGNNAHWYGFDLFEDYPFNKSTEQQTRHNIASAGFNLEYSLYRLDITKSDWFMDKILGIKGDIDFMHIDISNDGDTVRDVVNNLTDFIKIGGLLLFEGGSEARDNVDWMKLFQKPSLRNALTDIIKNDDRWELYRFIDDFPSMTVLGRVS